MPTATVTPEAQTIVILREALKALLRAAAPTLPLLQRYDRAHYATLHDALDTAFGVLAMDTAQRLAQQQDASAVATFSAEMLACAFTALEAARHEGRPGGAAA